LDRVSTGSGSDLVDPWSRMLIMDQVAIAPCTDPIQVRSVYSTKPLPSLTVTTLFAVTLVRVSTAPLGQRT